MLNNLIKPMQEGTKMIETLRESRQERLHKLDMTSDNWFSKSVRPIVTMFTGLIWGIVSIVMLIKYYQEGFSSDEWTSITAFYGLVSTPFTTCIAWYFKSRRLEKMAAQNAKANIVVEKIKTRADIRQERKEARHDRKMERRRERKQDREDYEREPVYKPENDEQK